MDKKITLLSLLLASVLLFSGCIFQSTTTKETPKELELKIKACENSFEMTYAGALDTRLLCYLKLIEKRKSMDVCDKLSDPGINAYCLGIVTNNLSQCDFLLDAYVKERCYYLIAENKKDLSICENVTDTVRNYLCISKVAASMGDLTICDIINDTHERSMCISKGAAKKKDLSICDNKISDFYERIDCYSEVALEKKDITICNKIKDSKEKDECYLWIGEEKKDPATCKRIKDQVFKAQCIIEVADSVQDPTICSGLKNDDADFCYLHFVSLKQDIRYLRICDGIKTDSNKVMCYTSVCGNLEEGNDKDYCYLIFRTMCGGLQDEAEREQCDSIIAPNTSTTVLETTEEENEL